MFDHSVSDISNVVRYYDLQMNAVSVTRIQRSRSILGMVLNSEEYFRVYFRVEILSETVTNDTGYDNYCP